MKRPDFDTVLHVILITIPLALAAALIVFAVIAIPAAIEAHEKRVTACEAQGGTVKEVSKTSTGTGVGANGKPVVTTNTETTYYCLRDGAVLDIW